MRSDHNSGTERILVAVLTPNVAEELMGRADRKERGVELFKFAERVTAERKRVVSPCNGIDPTLIVGK